MNSERTQRQGDTNMTKEDKQVIEDVKFILNSGDTGIIDTLKVTLRAYLKCIAVNREHAAAEQEYTALKKEYEDLLAKKRRRDFALISKTTVPRKRSK
jgi:hypothetical protein